MKLVSVIVVSYRSADTIVQTLDSIKAQTYKNIELLVSDDCSPDNSVEVAQRWIAENQSVFKTIKLITAPQNGGISANINRALAAATGEYVKLIAADDYMVPEAIEEYVKFCEENPKAVPIARVKLFSNENADYSSIQRYCDNCYDFAKMNYEEQYRMLLIQNCIVAPSCSFYPMELVKAVGGYDERYRWFEDYPMNLKIMNRGYRCGFIDKELVCYRISGQSITASNKLRLKKDEMKFFFRLKFWYMFKNRMGWEAIKQSRYWLLSGLKGL